MEQGVISYRDEVRILPNTFDEAFRENNLKAINYLAKTSIVDVRQGFEYASALVFKFSLRMFHF